MVEECIFCRIVAGTAPGHRIYEDGKHLAFLDAFPLVKGQTNVVTKKHYSSYQFEMPDGDYMDLFVFAKKVGKMLDRGLGAQRTVMIVQGTSIDHVHIKLFPILRINKTSPDEKTYAKLRELMNAWYSGYIIGVAGRERADESELEKLAATISKENAKRFK